MSTTMNADDASSSGDEDSGGDPYSFDRLYRLSLASMVKSNNEQGRRNRSHTSKMTGLMMKNANNNHHDLVGRLDEAKADREKENKENQTSRKKTERHNRETQKSLKKLERQTQDLREDLRELLTDIKTKLTFTSGGVPNEICDNEQSDDVSGSIGQVSATTASTTVESDRILELELKLKDSQAKLRAVTAPVRDPNARRPEEQAMLDCTADSVDQHERRIRKSSRISQQAKNGMPWRR
ncbi:hypothetical protein THAOC_10309 [Thalassiosira oceanica]|uniref:Uncharacterized protein n=1 Tax=Thalassiosira oceanica TaxID=159749 RepID=K0T586_THAOC|nr:hypothetical protein THAOC_10309 [Thalassiosira oceanica]|eukprot:EJK68501.1 hypothetical protein THAOC_10309 [Thalassiosira oceanica]